MEESVSIEDMVETDTKPHLIIASITVESYDPLTDNWEYVAQLQFPTMLHASVVYGGKLYISGGCSMFDLNNVEDDVAILMTALSSNFCREFSNAVFCYDPRLASWEKRQPMSVERAGHRMCILSDKIFAIGGRNLMTSSGVECSVECYSPEKDEWNRLSVELPGPVVWHGIAAFDDNIFIVGGTKKCLDFEECEDLNLVQCYMTTEGVWYTVAKLPVGYAGAECCTIKLPQHKPVRQEFSPTEEDGQVPEDLKFKGKQVEETNEPLDYFAVNNGSSVVIVKYFHQLLSGLNELRVSGDLTDVVLVAENKKFYSHKAMLSSSSDYFKAMFTGGMKESTSKQPEIELHGVSADGLETVLSFLYTSELNLSHGNFESVLTAASHFQMETALDFCVHYLQSELGVENFLDLANAATTYSLMERFVDDERTVDMFMNVARKDSGQIMELSVHQMNAFLKSDKLNMYPPLQIFQLFHKWVQHDWEHRVTSIAMLVPHINFCRMSPEDVIDHVQSVDFMSQNLGCRKHLLEAMKFHALPYHVMCDGYMPCDEEVLLATGGIAENAYTCSQMYYFDIELSEWHILADMPMEHIAYSVVTLDNFLYIAGGEDHDCYETDPMGCEYTTDAVYRYDPRFDRWSFVASMHAKRTNFCLLACRGLLYAIGGRNALLRDGLVSVEFYNPILNAWEYGTSLPRPMYGMGGCVYKDRIYLSGGCTDGSLYSKNLLMYDPALPSPTWQQKALMPNKRAWHTMAVVNDRIYMVGGRIVKSSMTIASEFSIECYDPELNQWLQSVEIPSEELVTNRLSMTGYRSAAWNNYILTLHGQFAIGNLKTRRTLQCYNVELDRWETSLKLPRDGFQEVCTLRVPKHILKANRIAARGDLGDYVASSVASSRRSSLCQEDLESILADTETSFSTSQHGAMVLGGLGELRDYDLLCDISLNVGNSYFPVQGALLAAASSLFSNILCPKGMSKIIEIPNSCEANNTGVKKYPAKNGVIATLSCMKWNGRPTEIQLEGISATELRMLLDVLYSTTLPTDNHINLDCVKATAENLEFHSVVSMCQDIEDLKMG
ncbi:kelch-like protein 26 [Glandiceps talaboti]